MLGIENFEELPMGRFVAELTEIIPSSVQLLFVRWYPGGRFNDWIHTFVALLRRSLRERGCHMWVFVDGSDIAWFQPDIDVFSHLFCRRLWDHPAQLVRSMSWPEVLRRLQPSHGRPLRGMMYFEV